MTMYLWKFNEDTEFHQMKISPSVPTLCRQVEKVFGSKPTLNRLSRNEDIWQVLIEGQEVGFIGMVEVL